MSLLGLFWVFEERKRRIWILFLVLSEYRLRLWLFVVKTNHKPAFVSCLPARFDSRLEHAWLILTQLDSFFSSIQNSARKSDYLGNIGQGWRLSHSRSDGWKYPEKFNMHHFKGYIQWLMVRPAETCFLESKSTY